MGYKVLIVLVWLVLPLAGLVLLRADYERYQDELDSQLAYANSRKDLLLRFSGRLDQQRHKVQTIWDPVTRQAWEWSFGELTDEFEQENAALGNPNLSHYPLTRVVLDDAARLLEEQQAYVREMGQLQDRYVKSSTGLDEMDDEIFFLQGYARQAQMWGVWDAYVIYQDRIAQLEDRFNRRQRQRFSFGNELNITSSQASAKKSELHRQLAGLPDRISLDQGRTYREDLQQRFANFDLRSRIRRIIGGTEPAQAAN